MRCLVLREIKTPLSLQQRPELEPGEGQVVVRLHAAALNRRDFWITQGMYPGVQCPAVLGSDGAGTVVRIGDGVPHHWTNQEVVMNPGWNWGPNPAAQGAEFRILGMPDDGTFADEVLVPVDCLHARPPHLSWTEAAALPLGGVTAYRALFTQGQLQPNQAVLITGVGGGVATFALQMACHAGARVLVTSSSPDKIRRACGLGALVGYDYTQDDWAKRLLADHGPLDLIVDGAGGAGYGRLLDLAAPGGRIVNYGATAGPPAKFDLFKVFWKQVRIVGSTMGSPEDFRRMIELVGQGQIHPVVDQVLSLEEGSGAVERMREAPQFGKVVLAMDA